MSLKEVFKGLIDPRDQSRVRHKLVNICIMAICATVCGFDGLTQIFLYIQDKKGFFKENFGIENFPSKATLSRLLRIIKWDQVRDAVMKIMRENAEKSVEIIAIDGKAIRSTAKRKDNQYSALQVVTVINVNNGVVEAQEKIYDKTNEITVLQAMLDYLDVNKKILTADAMHCQILTCEKIIAGGGNYVIGAKSNQKRLYNEIKAAFADPKNSSKIKIFTTPPEKNHGRIEIRICRKLGNVDLGKKCKNWPGLKSVIEIERICTEKNKTTRTKSYYVTSLGEEVSPEELLEIARKHWKIESLHWMLDVVFDEDKSLFKSENAQLSMNSFRKLAIFLQRRHLTLKNEDKNTTIKGNMNRCSRNNDLLIELMKMCKIL